MTQEVGTGMDVDPERTIVMTPVRPDTAPSPASVDRFGAPGSGDLTADLVATSVWSDEMLFAAGIPIVDVPVVSVGGGMGSFVFADYLRTAGVAARDIRILTSTESPWDTYEYLTRVSQSPRGERLRSDSQSCPDNVWGFPAYALREAWKEHTLAPLWNVFTEPFLTDYYTPKAGMVFDALAREAERIGWRSMVAMGQVRTVRKRSGGGYLTILTPPEGSVPTKRVAFRSRFVHVAVGYPGLRFLPDLQAYRDRYGDYSRVVNAYSPHEHVYEELRRRPGTVVLRGGGIVASRILQRLIDDRDHFGAQTTIVHLFRTYVAGAQGKSIFRRRPGSDGWSYQGFNWPKSAWGGQDKARMTKLEGQERLDFLESMGGTTTPYRKLWRQQLARGRREGFYRLHVGVVKDVAPGPDQTVMTRIEQDGTVVEVQANFVIDATGLDADITENRVLADLLQHGGAGRNLSGRLDVERTFEVRGTANDQGRVYAAGMATLGGYYAGVDSFLGLQYAALAACDDMAGQGFCKRIGVWHSTKHWWKWALNQRI